MEAIRRCKAHLTNGSGGRCKKAAIKGGTVCGTHGGSAPQVKRSARERLLEAADPAAARLVKALESVDERAAIKAAQLILDRAGIGPMSAVELSGEIAVTATSITLDALLATLSTQAKRDIIEILEREKVLEKAAIGAGMNAVAGSRIGAEMLTLEGECDTVTDTVDAEYSISE